MTSETSNTKINNKKVCLIALSPIGGFKSYLENISLRLIDNGYSVTVLFLAKNQKIDVDGVKTRFYDISKHQNTISSSFSFMIKSLPKRLSFKLKHNKSNTDILKNNLYHSQLKATYISKKLRNKLDLTEFDCVISTEEVLCNYFLAYSVIAKRKIGYIHPDYQKVPYDKNLDKKALKHLDYVCATSNVNAESIKKALPSVKNKIIGIPNPMDVASIRKKSEQPISIIFDETVVNLITVCRLDNEYKALDRLLLVAKQLKDTGVKFVWRIVGGGDYDKTMREFIRDHNLHDCIIMLGEMENPIPLIKASDLFVLQSYSEGYPMSVNEALVVNTPVLVTNYPSSSEQVNDGITGYIVDNNFDSVYKKIYYIITHKTVLSEIKNNLKNDNKSKFNNIDKLLTIMR